MISDHLRAEIRRLFEIEGWRRNTIARHLGLHHSTVQRALEREGLRVERRRRRSMIDPFVPFLKEQLKRYPRLAASVLYQMVRARGYPGGEDHFRHRIAILGLRPKKPPEAFFALRTLPAEQAQVDWAHFEPRQVEGGERRLYAFVLVLSYSRALFFRFFYDSQLTSFLTGHVLAFEFLAGVARTLLYDNLKSVVLERKATAIRFHSRFLELADHYGFDAQPVAPGRGNEKGRVERAIRYLRTSFFPLRRDLSLEDLNREALSWSLDRARKRPWPQDRRRTVEQAYLEERGHLLPLPPDRFPCHQWVETIARRSPYVRFDSNRYSIPHDRVGRPLLLAVDPERVRVFDQQEAIAEHRRCWDKRQIIEDPAHHEELRRAKRAARKDREQERLLLLVPRAEDLLRALAQRQRQLASAIRQLLELLDEVGAQELSEAIDEALEQGSPSPATVRFLLDRRRYARGQKPPLAIRLPEDSRIRDLVVKPHSLADYDRQEDADD